MRRLYISAALLLTVILASYIGSVVAEPESETNPKISRQQDISDENKIKDTVEITGSSAPAASNQEGFFKNIDEN